VSRTRLYRTASIAIVSAVSLLGLTGFTVLVVHDPAAELEEHTPGEDGRPANLPARPSVDIGRYFAAYDGEASSIAGSWPKFRGADGSNTSRESVPLVAPDGDWQPPILWSVELGEGHAGAAVDGGRVYVLDYDEARQADALRCFSLDDGREMWRRWYTVRLKRNHGISRTVPAVGGGTVVTLGPSCQLMACDAATGKLRWGIDLTERYGTVVPLWYTGQCPLVDGSQVVVAVGGDVLLAGIDLGSGKVLWETPNPRSLAMSHSSVVVATLGGARTYVYAAIGGIAGVSAEPESRGELLWETAAFDATVIAPSPVPLGDARVFVTAGYGAGSILLEVRRAGGAFRVEVLSRTRPAEGFGCEHQTPILLNGLLVGILPKDAGARREELACWDPAGRWVWSSGPERRFGLGPYLVADGKLVILNQDGVLTIAEATTEEYRPFASAKILEGPDAWAPLAIVAGRLIARDSRRMVCVDLRAGR